MSVLPPVCSIKPVLDGVKAHVNLRKKIWDLTLQFLGHFYIAVKMQMKEINWYK